jgi:YebC/PmpR family DNA-binding regulatory protein
MSGHNRWSSIKHKKGAADAKRGKIFTKVIKEITIAARMGGADVTGNSRLRRAVDAAAAVNMPKDNVTRAIKKGTGELEGVNYEEITYEGVGPAGTLFLMEVVTDNRNRTAAEVRKIFDKHNGALGAAASAAWAFEQKGVISLPKAAATEEQLFEVAVGAGAEDVEESGDQWWITTPRDGLDAVRDALAAAKIQVTEAKLEKIPKIAKRVGGHDAEVIMNLVEALDAHDDVNAVYTDFEPSEEDLAAYEQRA